MGERTTLPDSFAKWKRMERTNSGAFAVRVLCCYLHVAACMSEKNERNETRKTIQSWTNLKLY